MKTSRPSIHKYPHPSWCSLLLALALTFPALAGEPGAAVDAVTPESLINRCTVVNTIAGRKRAILDTSVFDESYKGKRMKYTGVIASIDPAQGIIFQHNGQWPQNWRIEAAIPPDKAEFLKTLNKGRQLTVEGDVSELHVALDVEAVAIRLQNTRIGDSPTGSTAPPIIVEGVQVDLPQLINALASAKPELEAAARNIQLACRYRDYAKGSALAESLAKDTSLSPNQREFALVVLDQLKKVVAKVASPSDR